MLRGRAVALSALVGAAAVSALVFPGPARAQVSRAGPQEADVQALIELLERQPTGMDEDTWRERRRDAARELGRLGDRRATLPLVRIVETERFDAIAEIAIESLGRLGDKRAVPALRRIASDPSRDRFTRDAATTALRRIGAGSGPEPQPRATTSAPASTPAPHSRPSPGKVATPAGPHAQRNESFTNEHAGNPEGEEEDEENEPPPTAWPGEPPVLGLEEGAGADLEEPVVPEGPSFPRDLLATSERWTFAVGSLALAYDTVTERPLVAGAAASRYRRGLERPRFGYSFDAGLAVSGGAQDREDSSTLVFELAGQAATEARFYLGSDPAGFFGHLAGGATLGALATSVSTSAPGGADFDHFAPRGSIAIGLGLGHGRTLDVGSRLRLRRIERVLRDARALGRPINADVAARVMSTWWALRGELGTRRRLLATIQILREAGVLLADPDPATTYTLLEVLRDGALDERFDGWNARVGVGETFLLLDVAPVAASLDLDFERIETVFARGTFARQMGGGLAELVAAARGVYRLGGDTGFYAADADATWRRFVYGEAWVPRGALELTGFLGISDANTDEEPNLGPGALVGGRIGWLFLPNRASRLRAVAELSLAGDELFVGARLEAHWGLLDATYASW